jgi:hypothetical protein
MDAVKTCRVCGSTDLMSRNSRGRVITRPYCRDHWLEHTNQRRHERDRLIRQTLGLTEDWKRILSDDRLPTLGYDRIVINERRKIVTVYSKGFYKSWNYDKLKRLTTVDKLLETYLAIGYEIFNAYSCMIVLERPVIMRARHRLIRSFYAREKTDQVH